jgi:colanic acid/amylovoran biosynthesis glycosyltransferase
VNICITRSERYSYSETFIRDQIKGFSTRAQVFTIHSGRFPERMENGKLLSPFPFWILHKVIKTITGQRNNYFSNYGLKKFLKENKIDVVLANYGLSAAHLAPVCEELKIPLLVIFHGHDATDKKLVSTYRKKYKELFHSAARVITVSHDMRHKIIALGASAEKVSVVPCGVNVNKFFPTHQLKQKTFLAVGRFVDKKGPMLTIKAFHGVWKGHPDARLIMVGKHTGLYDECKLLTKELGIQDAVSFPGILDQQEIKRLMDEATAFVQHSVTATNGDMEGTPVSILEAAASGLPVISTLHGGIKDAVIHERTGLLVNEQDINRMTTYMLRCLENPEAAAAMGEEARTHIVNQYDQDRQIEMLYTLARKAITPVT